MRAFLYDHRRTLFGLLFASVPSLVVTAFRWQEALLGLAGVLSALLVLKAASVCLSTAVRLVR